MSKASIMKLINQRLSGVRKQIKVHENTLSTLRQEEKGIQEAVRLLTGKAPKQFLLIPFQKIQIILLLPMANM